MEQRLERLERQNRFLVLLVVALVALQVGAFLGGARAPGAMSEVRVLPAAHAQSMQTVGKDGQRPAVVITTSQSGAVLYEFRLDKEGNYKRYLWAQ
ncbi:MAG TPA: hypothetical protein DEA08_34750 [Planctomycetes bacterium]|mgnify:CR=1 FL=1|nr:hypothetical protein [Planctomycetota bacterium]